MVFRKIMPRRKNYWKKPQHRIILLHLLAWEICIYMEEALKKIILKLINIISSQ